MDTLFHFIFSIIAGLALNLHIKHKLEVVAFAAFMAIFVDIDHFFGMVPRGTFHNIFFITLVPLLLFLAAYIYEKPKGKIALQSLALLLFVMMAGHVVADTFTEGKVLLLYPISTEGIGMVSWESQLLEGIHPGLVNTEGIGLAIYFVILAGAIFIEDFIYFFEKQHEKAAKALEDTFRDLF